ncbi:MAG TPA: transcriptional repressor [Bacillota bacterium]
MDSRNANYGASLIKKGIKPSYSRLKILEYLINHPVHPTADQIYQHLIGELPTLSKTTIYNTLKLLVDAGLAMVVTIDDTETRYDGNPTPHGHFKCNGCREIYDFKFDADHLVIEDLEGFVINTKDVYFRGTCPKCFKNKD